MASPLDQLTTNDLTDLFEEQCGRFIQMVKEGHPAHEIDRIKSSLMEIIAQLQTRIDSKFSMDIPLN